MFSYCHSAWLSYISRYWFYKWLQWGSNRRRGLNRGNSGRACRQVFLVIISYEPSQGFLSGNIWRQKSQELATLFLGSFDSSRPKMALSAGKGYVLSFIFGIKVSVYPTKCESVFLSDHEVIYFVLNFTLDRPFWIFKILSLG